MENQHVEPLSENKAPINNFPNNNPLRRIIVKTNMPNHLMFLVPRSTESFCKIQRHKFGLIKITTKYTH